MTAWKTLRDYIPPTQQPFEAHIAEDTVADAAAVARHVKALADDALVQAAKDAETAAADEAQAAANVAHILALSPPVDEVPVVEAEDLVGDTAPQA